ncbi:hypothetical protein LTR62_006708 [Meristemomyces frigidus]|uniref:Cell wall proline rich protein n=1 Tax=Meristemomyces frigidus TaxID=1508187 RepID=A0AAN7YJ29_9PEZI|nr:hypothetical protein LTR62_006708 [Meristemomyces frigidus]
MAEVAMPTRSHRHTGSISQIETGALLRTAPRIEMIPNPAFSFPALPAPGTSTGSQSSNSRHRRPQSMAGSLQASQPAAIAHRRQLSALPSFSFNPSDTTGLNDSTTPPLTPNELTPHTPSSTHRGHGHKRGGSEFVGGDSRFGVQGAISSSPTKSNAPLLPTVPPAARRHAHKRSGAQSFHDASTMMHPPITPDEPRTSSSLPTSPVAQGASRSYREEDETNSAPVALPEPAAEIFGPPSDSSEPRPVSRPRVGFSDNVEFISRPLSTISSETESSVATTRAHSVNNSISSVLDIGSPSPNSKRRSVTPLSTNFEDNVQPRARSSMEISKRIEKEGEWLSTRSDMNLKRPLSEPRLSFAANDAPSKQRDSQAKGDSRSHPLGFDRRRSEPAILEKLHEPSNVAAISSDDLHDKNLLGTQLPRYPDANQRPSSRSLRSWALSKVSKKSKERIVPVGRVPKPARPVSAYELSVPGRVPMSLAPAAETDLDAVLGGDMEPGSADAAQQPRVDLFSPQAFFHSRTFSGQPDPEGAVVDLDAALEPMSTPPLNPQKPRRELHSSRGTKDFVGQGMHYHRRAESAPELPPFSRGSMVSSHSLDNVFEDEGEEEDEYFDRPVSSASSKLESAGMGIHIVEAAERASQSAWIGSSGLRIRSGDWELERPTTSHGDGGSRLAVGGFDRRPSSIVAETIVEEASPVSPMEQVRAIEIVPAEEEPRSSSLTKSSDSSETPTLLATQLSVPEGAHSLKTPDTYQTSTFSSPDFTRRQGSFDTSRGGTAASSINDNRTISSCAGENPNRISVDDASLPSLTSSRSTMMSTMHPNTSHRDFSMENAPPLPQEGLSAVVAAERRRKRASIQSLSQLVGNSFSGRSRTAEEARPHTAILPTTSKSPRKEHRLKKLMFWRSKSKQSLNSPTP